MNLKKFATLGLVGLSALVLSACSHTASSTTNSTTGTSNQNSQSTGSGSTQSAGNVTVTFTDGVVTPATATVKSGGSITWVNNGSGAIKVGSDPHPTHTANQEITGGEFVIELVAGESSTVTIVKTGTWGFHDHMKPTTKGSVTVQ